MSQRYSRTRKIHISKCLQDSVDDDNCCSPAASVVGELPKKTVSKMDGEASSLAGGVAHRYEGSEDQLD